jgi:hypothetical protein
VAQVAAQIPVVSYSSPEENETALAALLARHGLTWHRTITVTFRLEDVKKLKNRCGVISALKKISLGFPMSDPRAVRIHFASSLILAKSIFSHLPVRIDHPFSRACKAAYT